MRFLSRLLGALAVVFAALAVGAYAWHLANKGLFERYMAQADPHRPLTSEQHLAYDVHYVMRTIRNPTREELHPWWVRAYYDLNPLHPGAGDVIRWGSHYSGPCGSHSAVLLAMLQDQHI